MDILTEEKEYLKYAIEHLTAEKEAQEKELREIPRRHTNVLQGDTFLVESLMSAAATRLNRIIHSEASPYFGRIDFLADGSKEVAKVYVGKLTLYDEANTPIIVDWRAPVCSLYYDSDLGLTSYQSPEGTITGDLKLKRQIIVKDGQLISANDTSLISNDELLQSYLNANADSKLKPIIATIQKPQYAIIQKALRENVIVQAPAGGGKSTIAVHRIPYLIYNESSKVKADQFIFIGPNKYFLNYVSGLLPELEVESIEQTTFIDIAQDIIGEKLKITDPSDTLKSYFKSGEVDANLRFLSSMEFKDAIDAYMNQYFRTAFSGGITFQGIVLDDERNIRDYIFGRKSSVKDSIANYQKYLINKVKEKADNFDIDVIRQLYKELKVTPRDTPRRKEIVDTLNELEAELKSGCSKVIKDYFKTFNIKPLSLYKEFISNIEDYIAMNSNVDVSTLKRDALARISKKNLLFEDLPALMHIALLLEKQSSYSKYVHAVIDEAQDLGLFHFQVLKELFAKGTFSIFGDLNQAIYPYRGISNWDILNEEIFHNQCSIEVLDKSYRTTIEIMNEANQISSYLDMGLADPVIRHGPPVQYIEVKKDNRIKGILQSIDRMLERGYKSIAIIAKTEDEAKDIYNKLCNYGLKITNISSNDKIYNGGICTVTSYLAKGLEFDGVIIPNASEKEYSSNELIDMRLLYVAMTRPLHELNVLYENQITKPLQSNVLSLNNEQGIQFKKTR